jgi:hypothetical protein
MNYRVARLVAGLRPRISLTQKQVNWIVAWVNSDTVEGPQRLRGRMRASQWSKYQRRLHAHRNYKINRQCKPFMSFLREES